MSANFTPEYKSVMQTPPFRFWCQTVIPLVYDGSLSYYELLCKVVDYLNHTISDVNKLASDVEGLYEAYNKLQKYVNDYFDNLDVQAEINNKLDEMAKNGQLESIIEQFLKYNTYRVFDTAVKLFASTGLYNGEYVSVLGHFSADDGGNCAYIISTNINEFSTKTATEGLYATPIVTANDCNAVIFGLKSDNNGVTNTDLLNLAIKYCGTNNKNLTVPNGNFNFDDKIDVTDIDNFTLNIYGKCKFTSRDSYKACFSFIDCNNIVINCVGAIYSEHNGKSTPPAGHYRPSPSGDKSSNRTAYHFSRCHNIAVDGGIYTGLEYVSNCTVDLQNPDMPNIREGRSINVVYKNMTITDTYQPFLASFAENISYSNLNITMRDGCGEGDHPFYVSRYTKNFNFVDCRIDMLTTYPLNVFKLSSAFEGSLGLDVAHIDNCIVDNLGSGLIALEDNTQAFINNCYVKFSDEGMPTDLPVASYKTPYIYFLQDNSTINDNNSIYINNRRGTDGNYLQRLVLSADTNSKYTLDNCNFYGLQEFVSGATTTRTPTYDVKNCNIVISKWLFWLKNNNADTICKMYFANNTITSEFKSYLTVANGNVKAYLSNNFVDNISETAGGLICNPDTVVKSNNYIIVNNTFNNIAKIIDNNLIGNSIIADNYIIKNNKLVTTTTNYINLVVDPVAGADYNSGTADYPLATLDRALELCKNDVAENRILLKNTSSQTITNIYALNNKSIRLTSDVAVVITFDYATSYRLTNFALLAENMVLSSAQTQILQNCTLHLTNCSFDNTIISAHNSYIECNNSVIYRITANATKMSFTNCTFANKTDSDTLNLLDSSTVTLAGNAAIKSLESESTDSAFISCSSNCGIASSANITTEGNSAYYGLKANGCTIYATADKYKMFDSLTNGGKFGEGGARVTNSLIVHYNSEFNTPT